MRKRTGMRPKSEEQVQVGDGDEPLMTKTQKAQAGTSYFLYTYYFTSQTVKPIELVERMIFNN